MHRSGDSYLSSAGNRDLLSDIRCAGSFVSFFFFLGWLTEKAEGRWQENRAELPHEESRRLSAPERSVWHGVRSKRLWLYYLYKIPLKGKQPQCWF